MTNFTDIPAGAGLGRLQRRAAELRAEQEVRKQTSTPARTSDKSQTAAELAKEAQTNEEQPIVPAGDGEHVVQLGECISSIAKASGHFWETIWNHAGNAELNAARRDPHVLFPGDRVTVPPLTPKYEPGQTETRHRFRRRGEPGVLRLVVKDADEPLANRPYVLKFDDHEVSGVTDSLGQIDQPLRPDARRATLIVGEGEEADEFELNLGHIHPIESISGVQARLDNLGYDVGGVTGIMSEKTSAAIERFCGEHAIDPPPRPQIGAAVRAKLMEVHGF